MLSTFTRVIRTLLLITSLSTEPAVAQDLGKPAPENDAKSIRLPEGCYSPPQRAKIAAGLIDLQKCEVDLAVRNDLIKKHLLTLNGTPQQKFWQEPTFVWGGIVVGVAAGGIITFLAMR